MVNEWICCVAAIVDIRSMFMYALNTVWHRPSEQTNTIEQFIVYVHRNEAHFTYIYVYHTNVSERSSEWSTFHLHLCISYQCIWGWQHLQKPSPKCHITYIFCYFYFALGLHPWLCWLLESSQILGCLRQLQTCARLMQGWVASAGCPPPPNKNPGYTGAYYFGQSSLFGHGWRLNILPTRNQQALITNMLITLTVKFCVASDDGQWMNMLCCRHSRYTVNVHVCPKHCLAPTPTEIANDTHMVSWIGMAGTYN